MHTLSFVRSLLVLGALFVFTSVAVAQSRELAITHVTIINPGVGKPQPNMTIIIRGDDIASVGGVAAMLVGILAGESPAGELAQLPL